MAALYPVISAKYLPSTITMRKQPTESILSVFPIPDQASTSQKRNCMPIDKVVKPLVEQVQSPYMIIANHPELNISVNTLYNYIDQGILLSRNIDLKRKVKFKPRNCHKTQITDRAVFIGRTYADFKEKHCDELSVSRPAAWCPFNVRKDGW